VVVCVCVQGLRYLHEEMRTVHRDLKVRRVYVYMYIYIYIYTLERRREREITSERERVCVCMSGCVCVCRHCGTCTRRCARYTVILRRVPQTDLWVFFELFSLLD